MTNREGTIKYLSTLPDRKEATSPNRVHNRLNDQTHQAHADANLNTDDEQVKAGKIAEAIDTYRASNPRASYEKARDMVRNRRPELFGLAARNGN